MWYAWRHRFKLLRMNACMLYNVNFFCKASIGTDAVFASIIRWHKKSAQCGDVILYFILIYKICFLLGELIKRNIQILLRRQQYLHFRFKMKLCRLSEHLILSDGRCVSIFHKEIRLKVRSRGLVHTRDIFLSIWVHNSAIRIHFYDDAWTVQEENLVKGSF